MVFASPVPGLPLSPPVIYRLLFIIETFKVQSGWSDASADHATVALPLDDHSGKRISDCF